MTENIKSRWALNTKGSKVRQKRACLLRDFFVSALGMAKSPRQRGFFGSLLILAPIFASVLYYSIKTHYGTSYSLVLHSEIASTSLTLVISSALPEPLTEL